MPETMEQVISIAADAGETVTPRQVKRWQVVGLLPSPEIQRLGRGKGTRTLYPEGTGKLTAMISASRERRLLYLAWSLWWEGQPVPLKSVRAFVNESLAKRRQEMEERVDPERKCLTTQAVNEIDEAVDQDRTIPGTLRARQKLGKERFNSLLVGILNMGAGIMQEGDLNRDDFERMFCPFGDWERNEFRATIKTQDYEDLNSFVPTVWNCELSDTDMLKAREQTRLFIEIVRHSLSVLCGELAEQWRILIPNGPEQEVLFFAAWSKLSLRPISIIVDAVNQWTETIQRHNRMLELLRIEVPAIAPLITPDKMGFVGKGKRAQQRHLNRLHKAYQKNKEELDAFFERHPEFKVTDDKQ